MVTHFFKHLQKSKMNLNKAFKQYLGRSISNLEYNSYFEILKRNEKTLRELFCFFILETILLGRSLNVNPFDQPAVELIKEETKKILLKS